MIRTISVCAAAILPSLSTAAVANSSSTLAPVQQSASFPNESIDWTGFSAGLELGYVAEVEDNDGLIFGWKLAYDYDLGSFILGGIIQYGYFDVDLDDGSEVEATYRVGLRGGIDSGLNWFYASTGYAHLDTHGDTNPGASDGYFVGLGYERLLSEKFTVGAEVVYSDFEDFDRDDTELDVTTLSLTLNYRF